MSANLLVQLVSKIVLQEIDGTPYCVWGYRISWTVLSSELKGRIGLIFSSRLDIKDPASYPGVQYIQGTHVHKVTGDDRQYVFQDIEQTKVSVVDLFFLAPCAEDSFTPVLLGTEIPESGNWQFLPFHTEVGEPNGQTQTIRGPAFVCPPKIQLPQAQQLNSSSRRLQKATLVSLQLDSVLHDAGGAIQKLGFLNQLRLQPGEVEAARSRLIKSDGSLKKSLKDTKHEPIKIDEALTEALKSLQWSDVPSQLPSPSIFASVPTPTLQAFGKQIVELRQEMVNNTKQQHLSKEKPSKKLIQQNTNLESLQTLNLLNAALVATKSFEESVKATPIGYLTHI